MKTSPSQANEHVTLRSTLVKFAGIELQLDARGVCYAPESGMLIVSDMHLEKASFLRSHYHHPLPCYDTHDTLVRLAACIDDYQPHTLVCLGDSFHDIRAGERLAATDIALLTATMQRVHRWVWVLGNHDPDVPEWLGGHCAAHARLANVMLTHEPDDTSDLPQIIGHFHPKTSVKVKQRRVRGPCFLVSATRCLLPSFGSYTGGLDINHDAIQAAMLGESTTSYLMFQQGIWPLGGKT